MSPSLRGSVDVLGNIRKIFSSDWPCDLGKENGPGIVFILDHVTRSRTDED
jgi:hypothetical protein